MEKYGKLSLNYPCYPFSSGTLVTKTNTMTLAEASRGSQLILFLTLKASVTTAAEDSLEYFSIALQKNET